MDAGLSNACAGLKAKGAMPLNTILEKGAVRLNAWAVSTDFKARGQLPQSAFCVGLWVSALAQQEDAWALGPRARSCAEQQNTEAKRNAPATMPATAMLNVLRIPE